MQYTKKPRYCLSCGRELTEKIDENNRIRLTCPFCEWTYYANPIPASACVVLNDMNELLIVKRKNEPEPGAWALPSGYIEIDETAKECAVHELKEETGLSGDAVEFLGYFFEISSIYQRVITFGFLMNITGGSLTPGDDALDARFCSIDELPEIPFSSHNKLIALIKKKITEQ
ncbi:MAG: NUDIX hydrolase [Candidatus Cloacimonetes bacterium]|nr:NUDIX hydrolase [Candidatus Cloacimonadota bacterium]